MYLRNHLIPTIYFCLGFLVTYRFGVWAGIGTVLCLLLIKIGIRYYEEFIVPKQRAKRWKEKEKELRLTNGINEQDKFWMEYLEKDADKTNYSINGKIIKDDSIRDSIGDNRLLSGSS